MNQEVLRASVLRILSNVTKRVKLLGTQLPVAELFPLVQRNHGPFAANFATVLIDISLLNELEVG